MGNTTYFFDANSELSRFQVENPIIWERRNINLNPRFIIGRGGEATIFKIEFEGKVRVAK